MPTKWGPIDQSFVLQLVLLVAAVVGAYFRLRARTDNHARISAKEDAKLDARINLLAQKLEASEDRTTQRFDFIKETLEEIKEQLNRQGVR